MSRPAPTHATLDDWIARDAIPFSVDSPDAFNAAVDRMMASLGSSVQLLGLGEALHGGEEILLLRNRLFQRLVEAHGYSAIAIESSFPRGRIVNDYITGRGAASYDDVQDAGFSHGFGRVEANRELVEWMRRYNERLGADSSHRVELHIYGCDLPGVAGGPASPRQVLDFVVDYLASIDAASAEAHRQRIAPHLGEDADWENPMAWRDPTKSAGLLSAATALRRVTEDLASELNTRFSECLSKSDTARFSEAAYYVEVARQLLNFFFALAQSSDYAASLAVRDQLMADNLGYVISREGDRGKVLAFAHNMHLQRGKAQWQLGPQLITWRPAGSHLTEMMPHGYAVIGSAVGVSDANGIGRPEPGTLEARLTAAAGPARLTPTHKGEGFAPSALADLPLRSGSSKNPTYFPLTRQSLIDFDWLVVLDSTTYTRGGRPLQ